MSIKEVYIIGAGLAGCEAAYFLANKDIKVKLCEMKPTKYSPAHKSSNFGELVCSNSLRSNDLKNAVGLLKEEMIKLDSLIMKSAYLNQVEGGSSLVVDREGFSKYITEAIKNHPNIEIINEEVTNLDLTKNIIVASGPLTSDSLSTEIQKLFGCDHFYFFDAAAPIIKKDSIDFEKAYFKSRYDKGEASYINCAMTKEEYDAFYNELINAECVELKDFEMNVFEGCMPFEVMAKRGYKTLLFGPMKPVGLEKDENHKPYAVVQLRQDDSVGTLYNIVGFQTHLKFDEQKRILRMIPGLEKCEIVRYGVMHKNSYIHSPNILNKFYQTNKYPNLFFAGQLTGVEGYVESAASGIIAGINMYKYLNNQELIDFTKKTVIGSMSNYISSCSIKNFQPMNANFGIIEDIIGVKKKDKREAYYNRSMEVMDELIKLI